MESLVHGSELNNTPQLGADAGKKKKIQTSAAGQEDTTAEQCSQTQQMNVVHSYAADA